MNAGYLLSYSLSTIALSSLLIRLLAPIEAVNKPLKDAQKKTQRKKSVVIASINLKMALIFYFVPALNGYAQIFGFYSSGVLAASLSLLAAVIVTKKRIVH